MQLLVAKELLWKPLALQSLEEVLQESLNP